MFRKAVQLPFRLFGIPVRLDISFLIFLPIIAWMIGTNLDAIAGTLGVALDEGISTGARFLLGLGSALGLFASILIHEIGHALVGRIYGARTRAITLWLLGGVAEFEEMPRKGTSEAVIAIAGPITSFLLGGLCWLLVQAGGPTGVTFLLAYLVFANLLVATFNLIPALPLDGGRILRSLLALRLSYLEATRVSAAVSKALALVLGFLGFLTFNVLLMLVAFFVFAAGSAESLAVVTEEALRGIKTSDLMTRDVDKVPGHMSISGLLDRMLEDRHFGYPVIDLQGRVIGMVSLDDVRRGRPDGSVEETPVSAIMTAPAPTILHSTPATDALKSIARAPGDRMVVVDELGELVGIISNSDLVRAIQVLMLETHVEHARATPVGSY